MIALNIHATTTAKSKDVKTKDVEIGEHAVKIEKMRNSCKI
jgi:hypothetical protein